MWGENTMTEFEHIKTQLIKWFEEAHLSSYIPVINAHNIKKRIKVILIPKPLYNQLINYNVDKCEEIIDLRILFSNFAFMPSRLHKEVDDIINMNDKTYDQHKNNKYEQYSEKYNRYRSM